DHGGGVMSTNYSAAHAKLEQITNTYLDGVLAGSLDPTARAQMRALRSEAIRGYVFSHFFFPIQDSQPPISTRDDWLRCYRTLLELVVDWADLEGETQRQQAQQLRELA